MMEKKNLRSLLIGVSAVAGIFCESQSASALTCCQFQDSSGTVIEPSKLPSLAEDIIKGSKSFCKVCNSDGNNQHHTWHGETCNGGWHNELEAKLAITAVNSKYPTFPNSLPSDCS